MSITPEHFYNFASSALANAKTQNNEFDYRNSASRAYYAAYHCCNLLRSKCPNLSDDDIKGSHDKLLDRFASLPNDNEGSALKKLAYVTKMMKTVRHKADYVLDHEFSTEDSEQQIRDAKRVLDGWKKIASDSVNES